MNKSNIDKINLLKKFGKNSLSYITLSNHLSTFSGKWEGYLAYKKFLKCIFILGDPIVPERSLKKVISDIKNFSNTERLCLCLFLCTKNVIKILEKEGFHGVCFGYEAIVDLNKFNIKGKKKRKIRKSINFANRKNFIVKEYDYISNKSKDIENEIRKISNDWCKFNKIPEPSFASGKIDFDNQFGIRYFICLYKNKIVGFLNYLPIFGKNSYYMDLGRRKINAPKGIMDFLMVKSFEYLKKDGINKIYLGVAPYSFISSDFSKYSQFNKRLFILFKPIFKLFYPIESEYFFKSKYATYWEPNYVYYYPHISFRMLLSFIHINYPGGVASIAIHKIKHHLKKIPTKKDEYF